jgi:Imm-5 like putative immunity protein
MKLWDLFLSDDGLDAEQVDQQFAQVEARMLELFGQRRRLYACDCVERGLPIFEKCFPDDDRPRSAIMLARRFVFGIASSPEMAAAHAAVISARDEALTQAPAHFHEDWPPVAVAEAARIASTPAIDEVDLTGVSRAILMAVESTSAHVLREKHWQYKQLMWYLKQGK